MPANTDPMPEATAEALHASFRRRRFLAMPLAGMIAWTGIGIAGTQLSLVGSVYATYIGAGLIVYLGVFLSRFTGEDFFGKANRHPFDGLFLHTVAMALLVFVIAIPFARVDPTSLPFSVGVLTGLMWIPFSWLIRHWVGWFHALSRAGLLLVLYYAFPDHRFVAIPFGIVLIYALTILVLELRWRQTLREDPAS